MMALCGELATEGTPDGNRQLAGLYLKNLITAHVGTLYCALLRFPDLIYHLFWATGFEYSGIKDPKVV